MYVLRLSFRKNQRDETPVLPWPFSKSSRRDHHNVVNLRNCVLFPGDQFKSQICGIGCRGKAHRVVEFEVARSKIASIDRLHRLVIDHHSYESLPLSTLVEEGSESQVV